MRSDLLVKSLGGKFSRMTSMRQTFLKGMMLLAACVSANAAKAQLTGVKTIPGDYATVTAAVNALNTSGVGPGGVTFELAAGTTFTETVPVITATGTATDSIVFKRSTAAGTNPKIIPATAGTIASTTTLGAIGDAIITINGGDFIVFDGIDLQTNATFTAAGMMEYGYLLTKASGTDASKNVTIRNCTVTLNKAAVYSFGIYVSNFSGGVAATVTSIGGRTENIKITNNTITICYGGIQLRGFASAAPYDFYDQNIEVGEDGGNVLNNLGGSTTTIYCMYSIYQNNLKVANNTINNTANGGAATAATLYGIFNTTGINSNATYHHNTITLTQGGTTSTTYSLYNAAGSTGTNNLVKIYNNAITGFTAPALTTGDFYGVYQTGTPYQTQIYNNTITSNTLAGTTAIFYGIYNSGAVINQTSIYGNTISSNSKVGTGAMYGIYNSPAATCTSDIYSNTINGNNSNTGANHGIYVNAGLLNNIYKNSIYSQTASGAAGSVFGMTIASGPVATNVYNNFISNLTAPIGTATADIIRGISITSTTANTKINLLYNTIYLNATSTGATFGVTGVYHTSSAVQSAAVLTMKNNIIVNTSTPTGAGIVSAFRRPDATLFNYSEYSNNNDYYVGATSASKVLFYNGATGDQTISALKIRLASRDANSISEMPPFQNISTLPYDLHITPGIPTQLESGGSLAGMPVTVADDYDSQPRSLSLPDIGADEFAGIISDFVSPVINFTPLTVGCNAGNRTLTATLTDATGVPLAGLVPRIYYRKNNTGSWSSQPGTLTSGTTNDGTWQFTIMAADMGGLVLLDTVSYYVVAQDLAATSNLGSIPYGAAGTDVSNITTHPSTTYQYVVASPLTGTTYTIDRNSPSSTTNFQTFVTASNMLACGVSSAVTLTVTPSSGPYTEQVIIPVIPGASSTNTVTIQGNNNVLTYLSTNTNERAVLKLNGTDYLTVNNLTINPTGTSTAQFGYGVQLMNDADNNTISNCTINIGLTATSSVNYAGIIISENSTPTSVVTTGDSKCDNNSFTSNVITGGYAGISLEGGDINTSINNNSVIGNTIKEFYIYGIYASGAANMQIKNNDISRPTHTSPSTFYGIHVTGYVSNATVNANRIHNPFTGSPASTSTGYGLYIAGDAPTGISNIYSNNLIYNMDGNGILYGSYTAGNGSKLYHNTISIDVTGSTTTSTTYGIYVAADEVKVKNNIVTMARGGTGTKYIIYYSSGLAFEANNNLYYLNAAGGTNNYGYYSGAQATFAAWKTASGQDAASPTPAAPGYANPAISDLTPTNTSLDNLGTPVGITTDVISVARSATAPDLGAYEFGSYPLRVNVLSFSARKDGRDVKVKWSVAVEDNMSAYAIERSADGRTFTEVGQVKAARLSDYSFNDMEAVTYATGNKLYYRLRTIENNGKLAYSKIAIVNLDAADDLFTVYPNPFAASVTIKATTAQAGTCAVMIKDISGRTVATQTSDIEAGTNYINVSGLDKLASGTYHVIANINGKIELTTITK